MEQRIGSSEFMDFESASNSSGNNATEVAGDNLSLLASVFMLSSARVRRC